MDFSSLFGKSRRIPNNMNGKLCLAANCNASGETHAVAHVYCLQGLQLATLFILCIHFTCTIVCNSKIGISIDTLESDLPLNF